MNVNLFTIPLPSRGFAHLLISSRGQSHEYSIIYRDKTFNQKSNCSENALKLTCSNVEFQNFPKENLGLPLKGRGMERREEEGKELGIGENCAIGIVRDDAPADS